MKNHKTAKNYLIYSIPSHLACYIEYGDSVPDNELDEQAYNQFIVDNDLSESIAVIGENQFFEAFHDLRNYGILPADCIEITYVII